MIEHKIAVLTAMTLSVVILNTAPAAFADPVENDIPSLDTVSVVTEAVPADVPIIGPVDTDSRVRGISDESIGVWALTLLGIVLLMYAAFVFWGSVPINR